MISKKLRILLLLSIPVFIIHGIEEYLTDFYSIDNWIKNLSAFLNIAPKIFFIVQQISWWILLILTALVIENKTILFAMSIFTGLIMIFEMQHLILSLSSQAYSSGLITALLFPILGFFYWKELIKQWGKVK